MAVGTLSDGTSVVVSGSIDGTVRVWDLDRRSPRGQPLTDHQREVSAVGIGRLPDGTSVVVSGSIDGTVRVCRHVQAV